MWNKPMVFPFRLFHFRMASGVDRMNTVQPFSARKEAASPDSLAAPYCPLPITIASASHKFPQQVSPVFGESQVRDFPGPCCSLNGLNQERDDHCGRIRKKGHLRDALSFIVLSKASDTGLRSL
jgi:hypothetical protein